MIANVALQPSQHAVRRSGAIATALTAAAMLSGIALRWLHLGKLSLWLDEGFTAWISGLSLAEMVRESRIDTSPPFYYALEHGWVSLFGNSEFALRALSALFGTLSLPLFYFLAKKVLKDSVAVGVATWLFAFSVMQVWYSREARTYEMASFFSLLALYALILFLEKGSVASFVVIVLSVAATLYMHSMMFFYLLALNVTWLIYPSGKPWARRVKEVLIADVLLGILYVPWAHALLTQVSKVHGGFWIPRPTYETLFHTLVLFCGFKLDYLQAVALRLLPLSPHAAWVCVLLGASLLSAAMVAGGLGRVSSQDRSKYVSLLVYWLLPILIVFVLSRIARPVFVARAFVSSSVVVPIVFAYPFALRKERKWRVVYAFLGIVLGTTVALSGFGLFRHQQKEDWRGVTASLLGIQESRRLIVFAPGYGDMVFNYYTQRFRAAAPNIAMISIPIQLKGHLGLGDMTPLRLAVESREYSEIDAVLIQEKSLDPDGVVFGYLNSTFPRHEEQRFYGIRLVRFLTSPH